MLTTAEKSLLQDDKRPPFHCCRGSILCKMAFQIKHRVTRHQRWSSSMTGRHRHEASIPVAATQSKHLQTYLPNISPLNNSNNNPPILPPYGRVVSDGDKTESRDGCFVLNLQSSFFIHSSSKSERKAGKSRRFRGFSPHHGPLIFYYLVGA